MKIVAAIREMQDIARGQRLKGDTIGFVPTMGFLHEGHLSLIRLAKSRADKIITSIFVNPTQFGPGEDFSRYPRNLKGDTQLADSAGSDYLFVPEGADIYPEGYGTFVQVEEMTAVLEGKSRPTHFRGVTTVVAKLLNIIQPDVAVFGQKDAQQVVVIKKMVRDLNMGVEIVVGPIVREPDGLAMSSRNVYLSPTERTESRVLYQSLLQARDLVLKGERRGSVVIDAMKKTISTVPSAAIDYISVSDPETLRDISTIKEGSSVLVSLAVRFGTTRLIDNILLTIS
ncbi:MAG TPA: pantoate--beta-alanine ligase [Bacteroidota bacterium]|nr:pantoate--beta-alanine ligase [Bacteroidota bacterium]